MASLFPREEHAEALFHRILTIRVQSSSCTKPSAWSRRMHRLRMAAVQSAALRKRFCRLTRTAIFPR